jgi:hypothetical protein
MKGVSEQDIEAYVKWCEGKQPVKILTTYDSFPRVSGVIGENITDFKIVVDEYQELLDAVIYRNKAVKTLLNHLEGMPNVTYLSATPIPFAYTPEELAGLPQYEIEWPYSIRVIPHRLQTNAPFSKAVEIIKRHKAGLPLQFGGQKVEEYFFFANSVTAIQRIIKAARLEQHEVKIICANNEINRLKLNGFKINNISDPNKTFTFCTKTVFYGADFYSEAGLAIIVSDGFIKSSALDIATDIQQIAGRIRNDENPFKYTILHIYNTGEWMNRCEFEEAMAGRMKNADKTIAAFNQLPMDLKEAITTRIRTNEPEELAYYNETTNQVEMDELKIAHLNYKFSAVDEVYTNGITIRDAYIKAGFNVEEAEAWQQNIKNNISAGSALSKFGGLFLLYVEERNKMPIGRTDLAKDIEFHHDIVKMAYDYLGKEEIARLRYDEAEVRKLVHYRMPATKAALCECLEKTFNVSSAYSLLEIKNHLINIFGELCIDIKAKASMLSEYYKIKKTKIYDDLRGRVDAYLLIESAF